MKKGFSVAVFAVLLLGVNIPSARAVILNWDAVTWSPGGSLVQSYDIDPSFAGNDIRITISGNTSNFISATPARGNDITGGVTPAEMALRLQLDIPNRTNFVTVTIDFLNPAGVLLPTFSLYDIDTGTGASPNFSYQDQIRNLQASFGITNYAPTLSGVGAGVTVSGGNTLTGNTSLPNDSTAGNATVSFTGGPVTQIRFDYGGATGTIANPAQQGIAISDITYNNISGVPEVNAVWVSIAALFLAGLIRTLRQNQAGRLPTCSPVE